MITEVQALAALPPAGFLRQYCAYAARQTTAPLAYHIGVGLSLMAVTCPISYGARYAVDQRPNLFVMLAGRSGDDQKSTAIQIGREILFAARPELIGDQPGSWEGQIQSLSVQPRQLLIYPEMGKLLASTQRGYMEPYKAVLTDLADATPQQRVLAKKKAGEESTIRVDNPRLSLLGACSLPFLERHTEAVDWTGGFLGRFFLIFAARERVDPWPYGSDAGQAELVAWIAEHAAADTAGWCLGPTSSARVTWNNWFRDVHARQLPELVAGARTRAPVMALKVALLLGWDYGTADLGMPWQIDHNVLEPAIAIAELYLQSVCALSERLAEHPEARTRRTVLEALTVGVPTTLGHILTTTKFKRKSLMEVLDGLVEERALQRLTIAGGQAIYVRNPVGA